MAHNGPPASVADSAADMDGDEAAREQRLRTLHQLAQQARPLASPASSHRAKPIRLTREEIWRIADRRAARRKRLAQGIGVIVVLLALGAVLRPSIALPSVLQGAPRGAPPPQASRPVSIDLVRDGVGCLSAMAWSQQGTSVAVIGNPSCAQSSNSTNGGHLNIYDITTGRLLQQINPDEAVQQAVHQASGSTNQVVFYRHLLWSFQGTLAATFFAQVTDSAVLSPYYMGLVLVNADGSNPQAFVQRMPDQAYAYHVLWDLTTGKASVLKNAVAGDQFSLASLPPALTYHWGNGGQFVVDRPLPPNPADPSAMLQASMQPIGDPVASLVSVWQPGELSYQQNGPGAPTSEGWNTDFAAWSPDGRYLLDSVTLQALLQLPGQPPIDTSAFSNTSLRFSLIFPVRDAGLQALIASLQAASAPFFTRLVLAAWRPDGALLAAQAEPTTAGAPPNPITLVDCASGTTLAMLRIPSDIRPSSVSGNASQLRWSPDGTHLLLYETSLRALVVWDASALPR